MAVAEQSNATAVRTVDADTLREWMEADEAVLIDVREPAEYAAERIPGSVNLPLSSFSPDKLPAHDGRHLVLHCQAGARATQATCRLIDAGLGPVWCFEAGMSGWRTAGLAVEGTGREMINVQRQTQIAVGTFVLAGTLLGAFVAQGWLVLAGLMGCGLIVAGSTGKCALAELIARLSWNQKA